jgi:arsenite methyltransferase
MPTVEIFDPPLCCSSGVCGADPDPQLARFSADLDWLRRQGADVRRYNLAQTPSAFTENSHVRRLMKETDGDCLPVILVDGKVVNHGSRPSREELARWAGLAQTQLPTLDLPAAGGCCGGDGEKGSRCG